MSCRPRSGITPLERAILSVLAEHGPARNSVLFGERVRQRRRYTRQGLAYAGRSLQRMEYVEGVLEGTPWELTEAGRARLARPHVVVLSGRTTRHRAGPAKRCA